MEARAVIGDYFMRITAPDAGGEIRLDWGPAPGAFSWDLYETGEVRIGRPITRRELRGPQHRRTRRMLRRTGFRQAFA
jgi:hypothetical protein